MISFLLTWRALALLALGVVTALLGWSALTLRIDPGMESMIPSGPGDLARLQAFQARFGSDEIVVLAFHSDRLFSRESPDRLDQLTRRVAELPHVARVLSPTPTNVRDLDGDELGPVPLVPYAQVAAGKLSPEALAARLGSHPLFGGLLVAKDARTASVLGELGGAREATDSRDHLVADLRRLAGQAGLGSAAFIAGIPVEKADVASDDLCPARVPDPGRNDGGPVSSSGRHAGPAGYRDPRPGLDIKSISKLSMFDIGGCGGPQSPKSTCLTFSCCLIL